MLEPGLSKSRGITLLDLADCRARLALAGQSGSDQLAVLQRAELELTEADQVLSLEDETALEGNVARQARTQLVQLRAHIAGLKKQLHLK